MLIQVEPADFFMYRVKLIYDLENPDSEDKQVRDYLEQHELEPKFQGNGEFEGRQSELMLFGGCYLGKHLDQIGQIQRHHVEVELLKAEVERHLDASDASTALSAQERELAAVHDLVGEFHQESAFQANENGELVAVLDGDNVRTAARQLITILGRS